MTKMSVNISLLPLFNGLTARQIQLLEPLFKTYNCTGGTIIFDQGEKAEFLYLILHGNVTIQYKPYDGPSLQIAQLQDGEVFGWSAAIGSDEYASQAESVKDLEALRIRGRDLERLCVDNPEVGTILLDRLAQVVSSRWTHAQEQVKSMLHKGVNSPINRS